MAEFTSHTPGTFSWVELATTDQKSAGQFYKALFGWDVNDMPIGPDEAYSMFQMRGKEVAAAYTMGASERENAPPHWNLYVTVTNVDEMAKRAETLGAKVLAAPFDVMDVGRMAVLQDPTGAVFELWQPKRHIGVRILNEPGALCWSELTTHDTKAAESFYTKLFGWTARHGAPAAGVDYTEFSNEGEAGVGMLAMPANIPAGVPSFWMPYFQVADCHASTEKARQLGATVNKAGQEVPNTGLFSILQDQQGAMFAVFQPIGG